jgi:hypothetical protein
MTAMPKPEKRGPKPRKPIERSSKPIPRRSRPAKVRKTASGKAKQAADRAWAAAIRAKGPCAARGVSFLLKEKHGEMRITHTSDCCLGTIDPAHVLSRTFPATRTEVANGIPICRAAHDWFTVRPLAWEAFCRQLLGDAEYERLYRKAHGVSD